MTLAAVAKCVYKHAHLARCIPAREPEVQGGRLPCSVSRCFREDHLVYRRKGTHNFYHGRIQICHIPASPMPKMIFRRCLLKFGVRRTFFCETGVGVTNTAFRVRCAGLLILHPFVSPLSGTSCYLQFRYAYHSFTISDQFKSNSPAALCFCNIA